MIWLTALLSLFVAAIGLRGEERAGAVRSLWISGQEYVNLDDWAEARSFQINRRNEDIGLTNRWAKLTFRVNSRLAVLNKVNATMSHPILANRDTLYISRLDLRTLVHPILYPGRPEKKKSSLTVALDPGHGGKDPGNQTGKEQEKRHTLLLAQEIRKRLASAGVKVVMTRATDVYLELEDRPAKARKLKADIFLSLHFNSVPSGHSDANGTEIYCLTPAGTASTNDHGEGNHAGSSPGNRYDEQNVFLAYLIQKSIVNGLNVNDRGIKRARHAVLRLAEMPAVLIEAGFMSDPEEAKRIYSGSCRRDLAQAIVDGLMAYKRHLERPVPVPASIPPPRSAKPPVVKTETPSHSATNQSPRLRIKIPASQPAKPAAIESETPSYSATNQGPLVRAKKPAPRLAKPTDEPVAPHP